MPRDTEKNIEKLLEDCMHIGEMYYWMIKEGKVIKSKIFNKLSGLGIITRISVS